MPRWYGAFYCHGRPENTLHKIGAVVANGDLGRIIPFVLFERNPRQGEHFVFVAFDTSRAGEVPPEGSALLQVLSRPLWMPDSHGDLRPFERGDISRMVTSELSVKDYARRLVIRRIAALLDDPFDFALDPEDHDAVVEQTQGYDNLMLWLSSTGSVSWPLFRSACEALGLASSVAEPRRALRLLRLLGHLECSADGTRCCATPSALVSTSCDDGAVSSYLLCGRRDSRVRQALMSAGTVKFVPQTNGIGPAEIRVVDLDWDKLYRELEPADAPAMPRLVDDAGVCLATALPPLDGWKNSLEALANIFPEMFDVKRFDGASFRLEPFQGKSGFYQLWPRAAEIQKPKYSLFYDSPSRQWLRGDWYGLRYLALNHELGQCPVEYDPSRHILKVPEEWRWPELYERALVLASGRLPARHGRGYMYERISTVLLDELAPKLALRDWR